jgi:hypothetical protein
VLLHNLKVSFARAVTVLIVLGGAAIPALATTAKNIGLVHGASVDGSGWKPVYEILAKDGHNVTMVQEQETSLILYSPNALSPAWDMQ